MLVPALTSYMPLGIYLTSLSFSHKALGSLSCDVSLVLHSLALLRQCFSPATLYLGLATTVGPVPSWEPVFKKSSWQKY